MRRSMVRTIVALAGAALLAGCGGDAPEVSGADGENDAVTVGIIPIVDVAPVYLGVEQGFFSDEGIDLTLESGQGGAAIVPGVISGQFQFGFSNNTSLILARSQDLPLKIVAPGNFSTGEQGADFSGVVAPAGSEIVDAGDLSGRTVAVNTLKNVGDTTVRQSVEKAGGDPDTVQFVELAFPDMPAALSEGRVDAAWVVEPFLTIAKSQGATEIASNLVDTGENFMIASYFTSEQTLSSDPELVERFTRALEKSLDYAAENPDAVREIIGSYTEIDAEIAEQMVLPGWSSELNEDTLTLLADLAEEDGLVTEPVDVQDLLR